MRATRWIIALSLSTCASLVALWASWPSATARAQSQPRPGANPRARRFYPLFEAISNERVADVRRRLPPRSQINDIDTTSGCNPLTWTLTPTHAPSASRRQILELLLARGADPNARDGQGNTAVEAAVEYPWPDALRMLIERGGDVRAAANVGATTLLYSVCAGNGNTWPSQRADRLEVARMLLERGLDPTKMSPWAEQHSLTSVDHCIVYDLEDVARLYARGGARPRSTLNHRDPRRAALARELAAMPLADAGAPDAARAR